MNAATTLEALLKSGQNVVAVLTREDAPVGRKRVLTPSPVALIAESASIPLIKTNKITPEVNQRIAEYQPELGIAVAYGVIFKSDTLQVPSSGWINLHYSLLPAWRGAAPVQHSILSGNPETGVTIFALDEGMDTGPILSQVKTLIEPGENSGELLGRLTHLGISGLLEILPSIESGVAKSTEQTTAEVSAANKINRADARIDWQEKARVIELKVRAFNPEPMAWAQHDDSPVRILEASALGSVANKLSFAAGAANGQVLIENGRVYVLCADETALELKQVQPAGKNPMAAQDWARGLKIAPVLN
ncbi:MAG: hypothetical protein RL167_772 [Actinomycetota bacterium]